LMMLCQSIFQINAKSVKSKHIPLPHLLTYTSILTHMVNIQPVSVVKEITSILPLLIFHTWIVIYQPLPRIEFIFHNLYFTLKHAICIKTYACHYYLNSGANQGKWEKYRFCVFLRCFFTEDNSRETGEHIHSNLSRVIICPYLENRK
jgi:hypothetical protein